MGSKQYLTHALISDALLSAGRGVRPDTTTTTTTVCYKTEKNIVASSSEQRRWRSNDWSHPIQSNAGDKIIGPARLKSEPQRPGRLVLYLYLLASEDEDSEQLAAAAVGRRV